MSRHVTLLGLTLDLTISRELERFYHRILAAPSGAEAEALAYGPTNPLALLRDRDSNGLPIWTVETLVDPRWAYLQDAVARCRAAHGELDVSSVINAATWDTAEAARSLGVSDQAVRQLVQRGDLAAVSTGGRYLLDRRAVEAFESQGTRAGKTPRVPALYVREGQSGEASLLVVAVTEAGEEAAAELRSDVDGVTELVIGIWAEAVILWGPAPGKLRAVRVRPVHGQAASRFGAADLTAIGRVSVVDRTNNRSEAAEMLERFLAEKGLRRAR